MKKIIKIVVLVFVGLFIISQVIETFDEVKREEQQAKAALNYDRAQSIGYKMVQNTLESANEKIEPGDDVEPVFDQPYSDEKGDEWVFSRKGEKGIDATLKSKQRIYNLEKIETGVYNTYRPNRYVSEGYIIRMINDGQAIEVTKDKKKTIFTLAE